MKVNRAAVSVSTAREEKRAETQTASIRVVVIEDQTLFRDGLTTLLSGQSDLEVVGSTDSLPVAIEHIRKVRPDIVLVGWPASSSNSQKVFAAIHEAKAATRVIMLVKDDAREDFVEAVRLGCSGIVPKQTSTELLLKSIRKVHAGEFWLDRMTTADVIRRCRRCPWRSTPRVARACRRTKSARTGNCSAGSARFQKQRNGRADVHQ
jgi:DNA-binding NarL/FixJ family response regulator